MTARAPRLCIYVAGLMFIYPLTMHGQDAPPRRHRPGDVIPKVEFASVEGMAVTTRPPEGRLLLLLAWDMRSPPIDALAKSSLMLFRRFHDRGLEVLTLCRADSEDDILDLAARWQLPWPFVSDSGDIRPSRRLAVRAIPASLLVTPDGRVFAVDLEGERAHAIVAEALKVSLDHVPMPKEPTPLKEAPEGRSPPSQSVSRNARAFLASSSSVGRSPRVRVSTMSGPWVKPPFLSRSMTAGKFTWPLPGVTSTFLGCR